MLVDSSGVPSEVVEYFIVDNKYQFNVTWPRIWVVGTSDLASISYGSFDSMELCGVIVFMVESTFMATFVIKFQFWMFYQEMVAISVILEVESVSTIEHDASNSVTSRQRNGWLWIILYRTLNSSNDVN